MLECFSKIYRTSFPSFNVSGSATENPQCTDELYQRPQDVCRVITAVRSIVTKGVQGNRLKEPAAHN
ncbi:hypothetical protein DMENIID0001_162640 [Sergentomyia squamirostris]